MHRDPIMEASEYSRIPSMPGLQAFHKVLNISEHGSEYAWPQEKEASQGKTLKFFLLGTLKTTFWMEKINLKMAKLKNLSKIKTTFLIFKKDRRGRLFPPSRAPVSMAE